MRVRGDLPKGYYFIKFPPKMESTSTLEGILAVKTSLIKTKKAETSCALGVQRVVRK